MGRGWLASALKTMNDKEAIAAQIAMAFASVEHPGDWCLRGSNEGEEPYLLEQEFKGKTDWRAIAPSFLDQAPAGFGSALHFFSDEAFHFYLPAYLIADMRGQLEQSDPVFCLTHGLDEASNHECVNPRRYGERTWFEDARHKFAIFNREECAAIVAYLTLKKEADAFASPQIEEALKNYWYERAVERSRTRKE